MNKLFSLVALGLCLFSALPSSAAIKGAPFMPEVDARFDSLEGNATSNAGLGQTTGLHAKQIAVANYNFAVNGAGTASVVTLPVTLPANAMIVRDYFYTTTAPVGPTDIAWSCQTANNIYSSAAATNFAASAALDGVSTGASTVFKPLTAACNIKMTYTVAPITAGNITAYIEYVLH